MQRVRVSTRHLETNRTRYCRHWTIVDQDLSRNSTHEKRFRLHRDIVSQQQTEYERIQPELTLVDMAFDESRVTLDAVRTYEAFHSKPSGAIE